MNLRLLFGTCLVLLLACSGEEAKYPTRNWVTIQVTSSNFISGGTLDSRFSDSRGTQCTGSNDFPGLIWVAGPSNTVSYVVIVDDPSGSDWVHLNLYNIPSSTTSINELLATSEVVTFTAGTVGNNSWSTISGEPRPTGWAGPCPPSGVHSYVFSVYALKRTLTSLNNVNRKSFESLYRSSIVASGSITGQF